MIRKLSPLFVVVFAFSAIVVGCSDDDDGNGNGNGTGIATLLKAVSVSQAPVLDGMIDDVWGNAQAFNITAGKIASYQAAFGEVDVMLKAVTDGPNLYILAQWEDPSSTQHDRRKEWGYANGTWSKSGDNEDRFFLMFDAGDNGTEGANCATMCHGGAMYTTGGGHVDVWHWKATRTNAAGFADDKWWDGGDGSGGSGRHSDASTVSAYSENEDNSLPIYMHTDGPAYAGAALVETDKVAYDAQATWQDGNTIPFYVSNPDASGSRWDVRAKGVYANGIWTVEFCRALNTGSDDDVVLGTGTVQMTAAVTDNSGGSHSGTETFDLEF